ncbi:motility protein A [Georgenia sp. AZ-5]|uniref:motility protein A n=1 Tax=Georgenia sp. AZ-5 TaxID=3367526 RepID=UPI0037542BF7
MDPATLIGIALAFGALWAMVTLEHASLSSLFLAAPMILVFGGTIAVGLASGTLPDALSAVKALPRAFLGRAAKPHESIEQIVELAAQVRSEGALSLERNAAEAEDPFVRVALQNIADGTHADELRLLLEDQIETKARQDRVPANFFQALGGYAPTIGVAGTVVSLTHVLENLSDPATLGPMVAAAFVATLWGILSANFLWIPIASRLRRLSDLEVQTMTLVMEGILAVQAGDPPRLVDERLRAMVPDGVLPAAA